jgi:hypothetical protein
VADLIEKLFAWAAFRSGRPADQIRSRAEQDEDNTVAFGPVA